MFSNIDNNDKFIPSNLVLTLQSSTGETLTYTKNEVIVGRNPNCENRLIIPKDVFKNVIFSGFAKKLKAKLCVKKYEEKNNIFAALICRYNMETVQSEKSG